MKGVLVLGLVENMLLWDHDRTPGGHLSPEFSWFTSKGGNTKHDSSLADFSLNRKCLLRRQSLNSASIIPGTDSSATSTYTCPECMNWPVSLSLFFCLLMFELSYFEGWGSLILLKMMTWICLLASSPGQAMAGRACVVSVCDSARYVMLIFVIQCDSHLLMFTIETLMVVLIIWNTT